VEGVKTSRSPCPPGSRGSRFESIKHGSDVRGEKYGIGAVRKVELLLLFLLSWTTPVSIRKWKLLPP